LPKYVASDEPTKLKPPFLKKYALLKYPSPWPSSVKARASSPLNGER